MSKYLEMTLEAYCESSGQPNPLNKGEYYKLIKYLIPENVDAEVVEKLDLVKRYLKHQGNS